ncbi:ComF family protein [Methyloversatilis sp.]|uniref:ComF family protein n=1 Tax=Methyloversatilis sp. TaxID=2569862 RepID=UPI0027364D85|nr:ComF family protein [Methyloversatilis sp.]MDP2870241.1 ComF family protein [Methyloversatilis sp.]MDP3288772.1 ComF family protein [Methyloversatilis sp.]MDP3456355.1 ComF family protein [Methyloversatilis sp.]MDP3579489.1 ComF family protein [Methyloversatilis sp.]
MLHRVIAAAQAVRRRLMPQDCRLCGLPSGDALLCAGCHDELPRLPAAHCPICALPVPTADVCGRCLKHPPAFDATLAVWAYAEPADQLIHELKFRARLPLAIWFAHELHALGLPPCDLLLAMPLHPNRLRERGFNQSVEIGRALGRLGQLNFDAFGLVRLYDTPPQRDLAWSQRRRNVRGAFAVRTEVAGRHVAVLDDVLTTGASLHEVARMLKAAGALTVTNLVLARTPRLRGK